MESSASLFLEAMDIIDFHSAIAHPSPGLPAPGAAVCPHTALAASMRNGAAKWDACAAAASPALCPSPLLFLHLVLSQTSAPLHPGVPGSSVRTQTEERSSVPPSQCTAGLSHHWAAWPWSRKPVHVVPLLLGLTLTAFCLAPAAALQEGEAAEGLLPTACPPVGHHLPKSPQPGFIHQHPWEAGASVSSHSHHKRLRNTVGMGKLEGELEDPAKCRSIPSRCDIYESTGSEGVCRALLRGRGGPDAMSSAPPCPFLLNGNALEEREHTRARASTAGCVSTRAEPGQRHPALAHVWAPLPCI